MNSIARDVLDLLTSLLPVAVLLILTIAGLALLVLAVGTLLRAFRQALSQVSRNADSGMDSRTRPETPGDFESDPDPDRLPTPDEEREALERLSRMPQFLRLANGDLMDLGSGMFVLPHAASDDQVPALEAQCDENGYRVVLTREALRRFVGYQEGVAALLAGKRGSPGTSPMP